MQNFNFKNLISFLKQKSSYKIIFLFIIRFLFVYIFLLLVGFFSFDIDKRSNLSDVIVSSALVYSFNTDGVLYESGSSKESTSPYWWLNSGAVFDIASGFGSTNIGSLPSNNFWRILYNKNNSLDTDQGYHPQNIFRLITKSKWQNSREEVYFKIKSDQLSSSPNRNESNGLLLFSRYLDSDNLYYAGLRVDGAVVIKKKINGAYYTLAYKKILNWANYDRVIHPNLIYKNTWIGLRVETINNSDGSISIRLFTDLGNTGVWTKSLEATDDNISYGGGSIQSYGYGGIRTDFMDVVFDNFRIVKI